MEQLFLNFSNTQTKDPVILLAVGIIALIFYTYKFSAMRKSFGTSVIIMLILTYATALVTGSSFIMLALHAYRVGSDFTPMFVVLGIVITITVIGTYYDLKKTSEAHQYATAEQMIREGAEVYLDGQLIDNKRITLRDYKVTIEEYRIILSDK